MVPTIQTEDDRAIKLLDAAGVKYQLIQPAQEVKHASSTTPQSIFLEAKQYRGYAYPDLLVDIRKSHLGNNYEECKEAVRKEGGYRLTPRQFVDFLKLLKSGKAFDERGKKIDSTLLQNVYGEIVEVKSPWRAEWLDAKFGDDTITYTLIDKDGTATEVTKPLEDCLMQDRLPGISLDSWLKTANRQGLPRKGTKVGNLYYWYPRQDSVAGFDAYSGGAGFGCGGGDPAVRNDSLGVRVARKKI